MKFETKNIELQKSFVFDLNKCDGCQACQVACTIENLLPFNTSWRAIYTFNEKRIPNVPVFYYTYGCNHCLEAPCMKFCPANAYKKDDQTGSVLIDSQRCIGCKYCSWQCPYGAPRYNIEKGIMEKCTFCYEKILQNEPPACITACPTGALNIEPYIRTGRNKDDHPLGFPCTGTKPAYRMIHLKKNRIPEMSSEGENLKYKFLKAGEKSSLPKFISELPLVIFTFLSMFIISYFISGFLDNNPISEQYIIGFSLISITAASFHLGNKKRLFYAIYNLKYSWISREIFFYLLFIISSLSFLAVFPSIYILGWVACGFGLITLFSIDSIYETRSRIKYTSLHSSEVLITGIFLIGIITYNLYLISILGFLKIILYIIRKYKFRQERILVKPVLTISRILLILPFIYLIIDTSETNVFALIFVTISELIDRVEFYLELEFVTPERQINNDLKKYLIDN